MDDLKQKCRNEYENTKTTLRKLSEKYNVKENTIKSWKNRDSLKGDDWLKSGCNYKDGVAELKKVSEVPKTVDRVNWESVETLYITGNNSLEEIRLSLNLKSGRIEKVSSENGWVKKRKEFRERTNGVAQIKISNELVNIIVATKKRHLEVTNKLLGAIEKALDEPGELNYVEEVEGCDGESETVEKLNEKKVLTIIKSVEILQRLQRQTLGMLDEKDARSDIVEKEKLHLMKYNLGLVENPEFEADIQENSDNFLKMTKVDDEQ